MGQGAHYKLDCVQSATICKKGRHPSSTQVRDEGFSLRPYCRAAQPRGSAKGGSRGRRPFGYAIDLEVRRHQHRTTEALRIAGTQMTNEYRSRLANELQDFLEFKRSLGIQYHNAEWMLRRFDRFVAQTFKGRRPIDLKVAIEEWLATFHSRPVTITHNFIVIRKFCLFLRRRDPNGFVPDRDLAPRVYQSHHLPYIFSPSEDSRFLVQPNGSPCGRPIVSNRITDLLRQTGIKPRTGRVGARPYDTRHSFAVNRLTEWYREGVDVHQRLAWLSAYLGHDDLLGTQDYLQLTPELRRYVSTRDEDYISRCWDQEAR